MMYRKVPRFSDARKHCCNLPKIETKTPDHREFLEEQSDLGLHCLPHPICPKT